MDATDADSVDQACSGAYSCGYATIFAYGDASVFLSFDPRLALQLSPAPTAVVVPDTLLANGELISWDIVPETSVHRTTLAPFNARRP